MLIPPLLHLYRLRRQEWLQTKELKELQRRKLIAIINHAYRNVRYYKSLFDSWVSNPMISRAPRIWPRFRSFAGKSFSGYLPETLLSTTPI